MRPRVVLFPIPFHGHINPMLHLANALHSKGFSITIIHTNFNAPDPTHYPDFIFHFIEDDGLSVSARTNGLPDDPIELLSVVRVSGFRAFKRCLSQILINDGCKLDDNKRKHTNAMVCLVADMAWSYAGEIADEFNIPKIGLRCGSVLAASAFASLPLLRQNGHFPPQDNQLEEEVLELPPLKYKDLPSETNLGMVASFVKATRAYTQGIICNSFDELEPSLMSKLHQNHNPIPIFQIGPLNKYSSTTNTCLSTSQNSIISWLNTQVHNSVLYVSFGSLAKISETEFHEVAWGLANSKQPFLWVVRSDMIINKSTKDEVFALDFLKVIQTRGRIVEWAPQEKVLAHPSIRGFWTHCGWNSTLEGISHGLPMICYPFFLDQKVNARYISDFWRTGVLLENGLKRKDIEKVIKKVMVEKEGEEMRERAVILMEKTNDCFKEGGSSYLALDKLSNHILFLLNAKSNKGDDAFET